MLPSRRRSIISPYSSLAHVLLPQLMLLGIIFYLLLLEISTIDAAIIGGRGARKYRRGLVVSGVVVDLLHIGRPLVPQKLLLVYFLNKHLLVRSHLLLGEGIIIRGIGLLLVV